MQFSFQIGCANWRDIETSDFVVLCNIYTDPFVQLTLSEKFNKPVRRSGLYGNRTVHHTTNDIFIDSIAKDHRINQFEVVNEFIKDNGQLCFEIEGIARWIDKIKKAGKYTLISEFKPWDNNRWSLLQNILPIVKPDGVGIQLHLKYNYNAEIVLAKLPNLILNLQDYGVDVHFTECSVWQHKLWFGNAHVVWDKIFSIAAELNVKSVTPWFQGDFDGQFMPSFKEWVNVEF